MIPHNRCLVFDIETTPILAYVWNRKDVQIALNQIKQESVLMAWSAKWLGDPPSKIIYHDNRKSPDFTNDKQLLIPMWKLLDEADIVITQNGQSFDSRRLNARFIMHGLNPPSPYKHIDTYRLVRKVADFTSSKLEYLTDKLCTKYKKLSHSKFPGMELWKECLAGNTKAWDEMRRYNIQDVLATEELYLKLRAWTPQSFPTPYHASDQVCGVCGSTWVQKRGFIRNKKFTYLRLHCQSCRVWSQGTVVKEAN